MSEYFWIFLVLGLVGIVYGINKLHIKRKKKKTQDFISSNQ